METRTVCVLILAGFLSIEICTSSSCFTGTKAVTWTLYQQIGELTWNDASRFCKDRGGYLPVTNTHVTMAALFNISFSWRSITDMFWIGLYNLETEVHNVWEANCCLRPPSVHYWAPVNEEPNNLDIYHCCRHDFLDGGWRTSGCGDRYVVVCEMDRGNCTYERLSDTTITTQPNASKAHVDNVSTCWTLCLELRHNGEECVAAVLEEATLCKLYVGRSLLVQNQVQTSPCRGSVVMLRRCFEAKVNQEMFPVYTYQDTSPEPHPWSVTCPAAYNAGVDPPDYLPPGVGLGLLSTMATCLPAPTEDTASMTTAATSASTTPSSSTQSASPTEGDTMSSSPPSSANSVNSPESSTSETTAMTATKDAVTDTTTTVCPCSCPYNSSSSSRHPINQTVTAKNHYSVNLTVIAKNQTSKYRRAKTSVWTGQTSHTIVGTPWVVACVCVFCCIALCDLNPRKWRPDERRRIRKNKVAQKP